MAEDNFTLTTFYDNWQKYQDHLKAAIAPLTREQLELRAAPDLRSIRQLVAHIAGARMGWLISTLGEDSTPVKAYESWQETLPETTEELLGGLDASWQLLTGALARWTPADMQQTFPDEWDGVHYDLARSWVVWHLLEHDLHHGGEVSLTLGMHGLPAPDI